jgi:hypothetical protein
MTTETKPPRMTVAEAIKSINAAIDAFLARVAAERAARKK